MKDLKYFLIVITLPFFVASCSDNGSDQSGELAMANDSITKGVLVNAVKIKPTRFEHFIDISGVVEADQN
ncbi:MAG: hypothetical protein HKN22_08415, partial [Bacteroidia bacterium]|nr:hypothetical protein [Bacteroidia bacterium]